MAKAQSPNSFLHSFWSGTLLIFLFTLWKSLTISPFFFGLGYDREIFRYAGMLLRKGYLPYRDMFDHKPPVIYLLAWLADPMGEWGMWIIVTGCLFLVSLFLFYTARKLNLPWPILPSLLFIMMMKTSMMIDRIGWGQTREFTAYFFLLLVCILLLKPGWRFLQGFILGIIFFTQQNEVLFAAVLVGWGMMLKDNSNLFSFAEIKTVFRKMIPVALGFLLFSGAIIGLMIYWGILAEFWQQAFLFNFQVYIPQQITFSAKLELFLILVERIKMDWPFIVLSGSGLLLLWREKSALYYALVLALGVELFSIYNSSLMFNYYFLGTVPLFCLLYFWQVNKLGTFARPFWGKLFPPAFFMAACFFWLQPDKLWNVFKAKKFNVYENELKSFPDLSKELSGKDGSLFIYNHAAPLALLSQWHIKAPSKWIYQHLWFRFPDWDADASIFKSMIADVDSAKSLYVLDFSPSDTLPRVPHQQLWDGFLRAHYDSIGQGALREYHRYGIWKLK